MAEKTTRALIEALLFACASPLDAGLLARVSGVPEEEVREELAALATACDREGRGFSLVEVAGGWQLRSRPEYAAEVARLRQARPRSRFSRPAMETLAIIAYRQPVQRSEIEMVRGVDCGATLKSLMEQGMVRIIGRKEAPGRPILYGTTSRVIGYFSLRDLASLPTLEEMRELDEAVEGPPPEFPDAPAPARAPDGEGAGEPDEGDREGE
jgi:segregation and condensation protein B